MQANLPTLRPAITNPITLFCLALLLTGCVTPKAVVESPDDLHKYTARFTSVFPSKTRASFIPA